jgi:hypothetical protein
MTINLNPGHLGLWYRPIILAESLQDKPSRAGIRMLYSMMNACKAAI